MIGQTLGQYRLQKELQRDGLGVTYLAEDLRLGRQVALRTFSSHMLDDADWQSRLQAAVGAAVRLTHANISTVFSIEQAESTSEVNGKPSEVLFITGEYVQGPTLAEAIQSENTPLETVLSWGVDLADALHHAHIRGNVHGALAPTCIRIKAPDRLKIQDFGMAHILRPAGDPLISGVQSVSLTATVSYDAATASYLAPEVLEGKAPDSRSDIYGLGMILSRLLRLEPSSSDQMPWTTGQGPASEMDRIIRKCLRVEPDRRYQSALELRNDLKDLKDQPTNWHSDQSHQRGRGKISSWRFTLAGVLLTFIIGYGVGRYFDTAAPGIPVAFSIPIQQMSGSPSSASVSSDGKVIVYSDRERLMLRSIDDPTGHVIPGAINARLPFWMEDDASIGYVMGDNPPKLIKHRLKDNHRTVLVELPNGPVYGVTWQSDGAVVLSVPGKDGAYGLYTARDQSGSLHPLRLPDAAKGERAVAYPSASPEGILFYSVLKNDDRTVELFAEKEGRREALLSNPDRQWYMGPSISTGRLLYGQGESLWWREFDPERFRITDTRELFEQGASVPDADAGTMVYLAKPRSREQLVGIQRGGAVAGTIDMLTARILDLTISRSGNHIASSCVETRDANIFIGSRDAAPMPMTFDPREERYPAWSPDDQEVLFVREDAGRTDLYRQRVDGSREARRVTHDAAVESWPTWSPDGRYILYQRQAESQHDLWYTPAETGGIPVEFLTFPADERTPAFSPDGRYVAYASNATGRYEIYVRSFPQGEDERAISRDGGIAPVWAGNELFFVQDNTLIAVDFTAPTLTPRPVLDGGAYATLLADQDTRRYAVTADGTRILVVQPAPETFRTELVVRRPWTYRRQ